MRKTVDVILKRIYTDKQIQTGLQKRTLKKLIIDSCTKTPFSFNGQLYQQIDGVSMGSPLGPTLADIIMTALEDAIIKPLIDSGVLKFYSRFVDDTLVLAKPYDFPFILNKLNSFHPQLQFTIDSFTDDQDIHFLDIKITPNGTSVYHKSTHTGQYVHLSSFTPWYRKTAWLRALIHRAYKLCSNSEILSIELSEIYKFASWNGFPKRLTKNLLKQFAPKATNNLTNNHTDLLTNNISHLNESDNIPKIWIPLPFIGKRGITLLNNCTKKLRRLIKQPVKFATLWNTTTTNAFLGVKDITPKPLHSLVFYKFTCPGRSCSYIGKTDRCLQTRIKEHCHSNDFKIYKHINSCDEFNLNSNLLLSLPFNEPSLLIETVMINTVINTNN